MIRGRAGLLAAVWVMPSAVMFAITWYVYAQFRMDVPARLTLAERDAVLAGLRVAWTDGTTPVPPLTGEVSSRPLEGDGPLDVTVWSGGRAVGRVEGFGPTVGAAMATAAIELRALGDKLQLPSQTRAAARLQVDLVVSRGPLGKDVWLFDQAAFAGIGDSLPLNAGLDGLELVSPVPDGTPGGGGAVTSRIYPHELVALDMLSRKQASRLMPDVNIGIDLNRVDRELSARATIIAQIPGARKAPPRSYRRFRSDVFVDGPRPPGVPPAHSLALTRGLPPRLPVTAASLRAAAIQGGRFLVSRMSPSGRYVYESNLDTGTQTDPSRPGAYSIPRHSGTTYFLAELYRITKEPFLQEPIERAFAHLQQLIDAGGCAGTLPDGQTFACVVDTGEKVAHLGSTALTVVALAEYQRATGRDTYLPLARKLSAWILLMQRPDGTFRHLYDVARATPDDKTELFYYSGEAALAMARMFVVTHEQKFAASAEHALDQLVAFYDFFIGGFFYGEEHWTCIASEAIYPAVTKDTYEDFCRGYGRFLREQQAGAGDFPDMQDLVGAYTVTPFVMPFNTPSGSRTEAMISASLLGAYHGRPDADLRAQIRATLGYLVSQQVNRENDFAVVSKDADGAIPASPIDRSVRIDYVQHVCSALIRASEWIDRDAD